MQVTPNDIDAICDLIHELCGVHLDESKSDCVGIVLHAYNFACNANHVYSKASIN